ncbi:MAG: zinc metallopeptidase [Clostridiales bacterium]|nr:zinc metallopeptidase [Clostridiales bacterium]MBD8986377.1 zinc metallopeptidase [Clostridiales bacterium]
MLFGLFWGDWTVLVLIPAMIFAFWAQINVQMTFSRFKQVRNRRGLTAADVARRILDANGLNYVQIQRVSGELTDHYDPRAQVVRLSDSVYDSTSVAAIGVAAHEVGHACQHAEDYVPLRIRSAIIPMTRIGSMLAMPVFILGLLFAQLSLYGNMVGDVFMMLGILLFSLSTLFQLVTLPTEFNASARALKTLESYGILDGDELVGARSTLRAAALTYVAALASSLASLLRLLLIFGGSRSRRN